MKANCCLKRFTLNSRCFYQDFFMSHPIIRSLFFEELEKFQKFFMNNFVTLTINYSLHTLKLFCLNFSPVEVKDVPSEVIDFMIETTTTRDKHVGRFLQDFNSREFEEEFQKDTNKFPDKISINKLDGNSKTNSCRRNVVYYKLDAGRSETKSTWNWTIEKSDENFSTSDNNSINFR